MKAVLVLLGALLLQDCASYSVLVKVEPLVLNDAGRYYALPQQFWYIPRTNAVLLSVGDTTDIEHEYLEGSFTNGACVIRSLPVLTKPKSTTKPNP